MKEGLSVLRSDKDPKILVITPLLSGHEIYPEVTKAMALQRLPMVWIAFSGPGLPPSNIQGGLESYKEQFGEIPEFIQVLDRDIILDDKFLGKVYAPLFMSDDDVAFAYTPFAYRGTVNFKFPPRQWSLPHLIHGGNYISCNSLYKKHVIEEIGGFDWCPIKLRRLSDFTTLMKIASLGYRGMCVPSTSFIAVSTPNDLSSGNMEESQKELKLIKENFLEKWFPTEFGL